MEFTKVVRRRRMVRNYDPDRPVPPEIVNRLLDHAIRAPSAGFSQGWAFLVLETAADRDRFWSATTPEGQGPSRWLTGMRRAPLIIVPLANRSAYLDRYAEPDKGWTDRDEKRWPVPYWYIDTGFAALLMLLTAVDEGLGACFFGIPPERTQVFREEFGVPVEFTPIGAITVGYPAPDHRSPSLRRGRRPVDEVVHRGHWSDPGLSVPPPMVATLARVGVRSPDAATDTVGRPDTEGSVP
jgi:nitroreductase